MTTALAALLLLLAWDATGLDLHAVRWFANAHGFALRDNWWVTNLLHDGGRMAAWALLAVLAVLAWRTPAAGAVSGGSAHHGNHAPSRPSRRQRGRWLAMVLLCAVVVPVVKRFSSTSCPWDLAEFGGVARHVSHWHLGLTDGGGGHCFPSGHAVAAFAFFGMHWLWRPHCPRRARQWLWGVLAAGALFGGGQLLRGAHYPSHTLWTAWLCWTLCAGAQALANWHHQRGPRGGTAARRRTIHGLLAGAPDAPRHHPPAGPEPRPLET